jgi:hypothetical protein
MITSYLPFYLQKCIWSATRRVKWAWFSKVHALGVVMTRLGLVLLDRYKDLKSSFEIRQNQILRVCWGRMLYTESIGEPV